MRPEGPRRLFPRPSYAQTAELVQPIVHAPVDAGGEDEQGVRVVRINLLHDPAGLP